MLLIYHGKKKKTPQGPVQHAGAWVIGVGGLGDPGITLLPGTNTVPAERWKMVCKHPDVVKAIACNALEIVEAEKGSKLVEVPTGKSMQNLPRDLTSLTLEKAEPVIKNCVNVEALKRWAAEDDRKGIHELCKEQVEYIDQLEEQGKAQAEGS